MTTKIYFYLLHYEIKMCLEGNFEIRKISIVCVYAKQI